jgi:hypothetical protein
MSMVGPSPILITPDHHPDFIRVIKSPSLKDSFVQANELMDKDGVRGVVWVPEHYKNDDTNPPQAITNEDIEDLKLLLPLDNSLRREIIAHNRRISTTAYDAAAEGVNIPHIDSYGGIWPSHIKSRRLVHTTYGAQENSGTILFNEVPDEDMFNDSGIRPNLLRQEIIRKLKPAWQIASGCALIMNDRGPIRKQIIHVAAFMPTPDKSDDESRNWQAPEFPVTRVVDLYYYKLQCHG